MENSSDAALDEVCHDAVSDACRRLIEGGKLSDVTTISVLCSVTVYV